MVAAKWSVGRAPRSLGDLSAVARRAKAEAGANQFGYSEFVSSPEIKNISVYQNTKSARRGPPYPGKYPRTAGRKKIAILIANPMLHRIERSVGRLPR